MKQKSFITPLSYINKEDLALCIPFFEKILKKLLPPSHIAQLKSDKKEVVINYLNGLNKKLPLIMWEQYPETIHATLLADAKYTQGIGRYFSDVLNRWLNPGKFLNISYMHNLDFRFTASETDSYFISQIALDIPNEKELAIVKNNIPTVIKDLKINILAVKKTRQLIFNKELTQYERKIILQENIDSILNRPAKEFDINIFDKMHHLILELTAEEKTKEINEKLFKHLEKYPSVDNRDIYNEVQRILLLFKGKFADNDDINTIIRILSSHFIFQKYLTQQIRHDPTQRHFHLKLFKIKGNRLAMVLGINILNENELFSKRHIIKALETCLPNVAMKEISDSFVSDYRTQDKIRLFYLEVEKTAPIHFTHEEIKQLKKDLPCELKNRFEQILHPVFMPRNEEEIMRSLILLSQQLKYPRDLPQCIISFEAQSNLDLAFVIMFIRIDKGDSLQELSLLLESRLKFDEWNIKPMGTLRKQRLKEGTIFKVSVAKADFLRKDYTVDLFKARHFVASELKRLFGEFRDFNGGILSKQYEIYLALQCACGEFSYKDDFLLENFFFSLSPPFMQNILPLEVLKSFFYLLIKSIEDIKNETSIDQSPDYLLVLIKETTPFYMNEALSKIDQLSISPSDLTTSTLLNNGVRYIGFIYHSNDQQERDLFLKALKIDRIFN